MEKSCFWKNAFFDLSPASKVNKNFARSYIVPDMFLILLAHFISFPTIYNTRCEFLHKKSKIEIAKNTSFQFCWFLEHSARHKQSKTRIFWGSSPPSKVAPSKIVPYMWKLERSYGGAKQLTLKNARICGHEVDFSHKQRFFHTNSNFFEISIGITKKNYLYSCRWHSHPPTKGDQDSFWEQHNIII